MNSAAQMYQLVNDVEAYPQFMKGCREAIILEQGDDFMIARLVLKAKGVSCSFVTRNTLEENRSIKLDLQEGPFTRLHGEWIFRELTDSACKVSLDLEFQFSSVSVGLATSSLFSSVANHLLDATVARAAQIYS